ncbi:MAG: ABC transporter permease, partial [Terriglobales bacterium]
KPLAYPASQQIVNIREVVEEWRAMYPSLPANANHFETWRQRSTAFSQWGLLQMRSYDLSVAGLAMVTVAARSSLELLSVLGAQAMLGRGFAADDMKAGSEKVAILTYRIWKDRFGADLRAIGSSVRLDGYPYTIIGVLPESFDLPSSGLGLFHQDESRSADLFIPLVLPPDQMDIFGSHNYVALGRLKTGVSVQQAAAEINSLESDIANHFPPDVHAHLRAELIPLKERLVGDVSHGLWLLFIAVGCVLLIICINVANLQLVRGVLRSREMAVRAALGARRRDLLMASVTESVVLAVAGGALGLFLCWAALRVLPHLAAGALPKSGNIKLDAWGLAFALMTTTLTILLTAALPGVRMLSTGPQSVPQREAFRSSGSLHGPRIRMALVGAEVLCSTALLLVAALVGKSFVRLMTLDRGFQTQHILTLRVDLPSAQYQENGQRNRFYDEALQRLSRLPGVESAGFSCAPLMNGETWLDGVTALPASQNTPWENRPIANIRWASPEYLKTIGIRLLAGRMLGEQDRTNPGALLSESAARKLWQGENAIGRRFQRGGGDDTFEVAGIIADARSEEISAAPVAIIYLPYWFKPPTSSFFAIRTSEDPTFLIASVRKTLSQLEPEAPLSHVETMDELVGASLAQRRFEFDILITFAAMALFLAALGLYGVLAYSVAERTRELGVRIALGAPRSTLFSLVFRQAGLPVLAGLAGGLSLAWIGGRLLSSLLFKVTPYDAPSAVLVIAVLLGTSAIACWVPSRRAAEVDPMVALRHE